MKAAPPERDLTVVRTDHSAHNLTVDELAERERTTPATVRYWVHTGTAPRSFKAGRRRLFPLREVVAWEKARMEADDQDDAPVAQMG